MSHNVLNIQAQAGDVTGDITNTISEQMGLGQMLVKADLQAMGGGAGTYYAINDNYIFLTSSDSYTDEGVTISNDTISITGGIYIILCLPTWSENASTLVNHAIYMQFQDSSGEALGNIATCNRNSINATQPGNNICSAYVEGPRDVHLKVVDLMNPTSNTIFPKDGTESTNTPFFIEIIRIK